MSTKAPTSKVFPAVIIAVVLGIFIAVGFAIQSNRDTTGKSAAAPKAGTSATSPDGTQVSVVDDYGLAIGDPKSKVTVEIFFDFACPHCAEFESAAADTIESLHAEDGALVVYRPMAFLNKYSWEAMNALGAAMESGDLAAAVDLKAALLANQPTESLPDSDWYIDQAKAVGVTGVEKAIEKVSFEQWIINANDAASKQGVTGTPTIFVNGERIGGNSIEELALNMVNAVDAAKG